MGQNGYRRTSRCILGEQTAERHRQIAVHNAYEDDCIAGKEDTLKLPEAGGKRRFER
jgi:hypothetical protein